MLPDRRQWDLEALTMIFPAEEASIIQQIPLSYRRYKDVWMWQYEAKGVYTVKSSYNVQYNQVQQDHSFLPQIWKFI